LTVEVFSNFSGSDIADVELTLAKLALHLPVRLPSPAPPSTVVPPTLLRRYVGHYEGPRPVRITLASGQLLLFPSLISIRGGGADRLVAISPTRFYNRREPDMRVTFLRAGASARISNARLGISFSMPRQPG
jgi:hypothetical protein